MINQYTDNTPYDALGYEEESIIKWLKRRSTHEAHSFVVNWRRRWGPLDVYFPVLEFIVQHPETDLGTILSILVAIDDTPMPPPEFIKGDTLDKLSEYGEIEDRYYLMILISKNAKAGMYKNFNHPPSEAYLAMRERLIQTYTGNPDAWYALPSALFQPIPERLAVMASELAE